VTKASRQPTIVAAPLAALPESHSPQFTAP
jgi:hypothetical protein